MLFCCVPCRVPTSQVRSSMVVSVSSVTKLVHFFYIAVVTYDIEPVPEQVMFEIRNKRVLKDRLLNNQTSGKYQSFIEHPGALLYVGGPHSVSI